MQKNLSKKQKMHFTRTGKIILVISGILILLIICLVAGFIVSFVRNLVPEWNPANDILQDFTDRAMVTKVSELSKKEQKLLKKIDKTKPFFVKELNNIESGFINEKILFDEAMNVLSAYKKFDKIKNEILIYEENIKQINEGRKYILLAKKEQENENYLKAVEYYSTVLPNDSLYYARVAKSIESLSTHVSADLENKVTDFMVKYKIEEGLNYLNSLKKLVPNLEDIDVQIKRINDYSFFQNDVYEYSGSVEHVFTHCLIAFPELCYSSPSMTKALDTDCITPHELTKILENLYNKGYILVDLNTLYEEVDGKSKVAKISIPKGKKPLVLSIDDVTYDSRKMHTGMVDKLIVDENGKLCTYTLQDGKEIISYDNEVFPIVNEFVRSHPDFSFRGTKGMLCNTGFDGVFGYRTQSEPLGAESGFVREDEIKAAKEVALALKEQGWYFSSHGFDHRHMAGLTLEQVKYDTDKWQEEVMSIVGETKIMVWPYGESIRKGNAHEYVYNNGFKIFCGVGSKPYLALEPGGLGIFIDRKALDGYSLRNRRESYMYLFDTLEVWDPLRPTEITWK